MIHESDYDYRSDEIWKDVVGFSEYEISNLARVKRKKGFVKNNNSGGVRFQKERLKTQSINNHTGYYYVGLYQNYKRTQMYVHRLVALAFIPNPQNKRCINHINGIKTDNRIENLEWCTHSENNFHAFATGLKTVSELQRQGMKMRQDLNRKKVLQYDKSMNFIREWDSYMQIEKETGVQYQNVSACCNERRKTTGGFIWKFKPTKEVEYSYVSECCQALPRSNGDNDTSDIGLCPECWGNTLYGYFNNNGDFFEKRKEAILSDEILNQNPK